MIHCLPIKAIGLQGNSIKMQLLMVGLNHKTAPIELREQFAFAGNSLRAAIKEAVSYTQVRSAVLISTCNRTELYFEASSLQAVREWLWCKRGLRLSDLGQYTYLYKNTGVVRHLMHVACGLDSMVLGEVEILGQLKHAYSLASEVGGLSKVLDKLFQSAFAAAKKVRTQTEISLNPVSVAYLAVRLAQRIFSRTHDKRVLLVGAGSTARLLVQHLCGIGIEQFIIANRTFSKSKSMAAEISADLEVEYIELSEVPQYLVHADIVIAATNAPLPIIGKGMVELAMKQRKQRSVFMIDLAVPRNIEPQVRDLANVYLYSIDDLQSIAAEHRKTRYTAARQAGTIIEEQVVAFTSWRQAQDALGMIQDFREECMLHRDQALAAAARQLDAGKEPYEVMQKLAYGLVNKILHKPTVQMRTASLAGDQDFVANIRRLFKIEQEL